MDIPVYSATNKRIGSMPASVAATLPKEHVVRNRKGKIMRVYMKPLTCHVRPVLSRTGQTVEVPCGGHQVWAMYGTDGRLV